MGRIIDKPNQKMESGRSTLSGDTSNELAVSMEDSIAYEDLEEHKPEPLEVLEIRDTENYFENLSNMSAVGSSVRQESIVEDDDQDKRKMDIVEPSFAELLKTHEWKLDTHRVSIRSHLSTRYFLHIKILRGPNNAGYPFFSFTTTPIVS
jgi:hypothetical protein